MIDSNIIIPALIIAIVVYFIFTYEVHITKRNSTSSSDKNDPTDKTPILNEDIILNIDDDYSLIDLKKNGVIDNVFEVLKNIPSKMSDTDSMKILSSINNYYQNSDTIKEFYAKCNSITHIPPYDTKYTLLIINLFIKMDNKYNKLKKKKQKQVAFSKNPPEFIDSSPHYKQPIASAQLEPYTNYSPF
jgi:hypothetical protein